MNVLVVESEDVNRDCGEALRLCAEKKRYDVVLIALKFLRGTRAGGTRLIDALLEKDPRQRFAFMTSSPVLKKPFTLQDVDDFMGAFRRPGQSRFGDTVLAAQTRHS
jgi:hypothetical protein